MESKGAAYHERVREGFRAQAARHPERIRVIDASAPLERVTEQIWEIVQTEARREPPRQPRV